MVACVEFGFSLCLRYGLLRRGFGFWIAGCGACYVLLCLLRKIGILGLVCFLIIVFMLLGLLWLCSVWGFGVCVLIGLLDFGDIWVFSRPRNLSAFETCAW